MESIIIKSSSGSYTGKCIDKIITFYGIPYAPVSYTHLTLPTILLV